MGIWLAFFYWLGSSILSALLIKPKVENARPSGLDEFQAPTATEGRIVPIIVGKVRMSGINAIWYGDLRTKAIREKVGGFAGIGGSKVTIGYEYSLGVQMAICRGPIDGYDRIWLDDKIIYDGGETTSNFSIDDPEYFGGKTSGGGVKFTLEFYRGTFNQATSSYLASFQTPLTAYRRTAYMILTDGAGGPGYIGNSPQLRNIAIEPYWYPNGLAVTGGKHRIGEDANPICFLYELLSGNDDWGVTFPVNDILLTGDAAAGALRAVAEQCYDENLGFSMVLDHEFELREIIVEIERHVDGAFRLDLTDGLFKIVLARPPAGAVLLLDETNIEELEDYSRGTWTNTQNEVRISFADRAKDYDSTYARDHDLANLQITGKRSHATMNFPGIKDAGLANRVAAREMVSVAFPLAKVKLKCNRSVYAIQRGDPFDWTWDEYGIVELPMRVIKIAYGDDQRAPITIDAVEDIYRIGIAGYVDPPASGFQPPTFSPVAALAARIWEPPTQLSSTTYQPILLVARNGGLHINYDVYTDVNGGVDNLVLTNEAVDQWTPTALLSGAMVADLDGPPHFTDTITIYALRDITVADLAEFANSGVYPEAPNNVILIDDELVYWTGYVDNLNSTYDLTIVRGAFGTVPANHSADARIWFPTLGAGVLADPFNAITLGSVFRVKVTPRTATGVLAVASASPVPLSANYTQLYVRPYAPGNPAVNGNLFVDEDWTRTPGTLRITFNSRNRQSQSFATKQDDTSLTTVGSTSYSVVVRRVDTGVAVVTRNNIPGSATGAAFNTQGFIPQTSPGIPDELDFYLDIYARDATRESQHKQTVPFEVFGFGLDFGGDFGGQDTGGTNYGTVLKQGAAPYAPEPVPGVNTLKSITFTFSGAPTASESVLAYFTIAGGDFGIYQASTTATGSTAEALAQDLTSDITTLLTTGGRDTTIWPYVELLRNGSTVTLSSYYFSFSGWVSNLAGNAGANLTQEPQASTGSNVRQRLFIDFWDSQLINNILVDVLAPDVDPFYDRTTYNALIVYGLTHDARLALSATQDGRPDDDGRQFSLTSKGLNDQRLLACADLVDVINANTEFSAYATASLGHNTEPVGLDNGNNIAMTRTAVTLIVAEGYRIRTVGPRGVQELGGADQTGHSQLPKQIVGPAIKQSLAQIIRVTAGRGVYGANYIVGQTFTLTLNGVNITYIASAPDVALEGATSRYRDPVIEYWLANLPSGFTGTFERYPNRDVTRSDGRTFFYMGLYIRRTVANTPFTYSTSSGYGSTTVVTIT